MNSLIKTKIFVFQGGGYDGCIWEWNALLFEGGEISHELISGRIGKRVVDAVRKQGAFKTIRNLRRDRDTSFVIRTQSQWEYFCKEWNSGFVRHVAQIAGQSVRRDRCGHFYSYEEIVHTGYKGDGGIGIQFTDNKCRECADIEHDEYIAREWKHLRLRERIIAIARARDDGFEVSIFAARRDTFPPIAGRHVWEPEFY